MNSFIRYSLWERTKRRFYYSLSASDITVVGSSTDGLTGKSYSVDQIVVHPNYGSTTLDYDFACVQISSTFYYWKKRAHNLPSAELEDNTTINVAGYGCTVSRHQLPKSSFGKLASSGVAIKVHSTIIQLP